MGEKGVWVRRDSAVKLVEVLAGESPARADCPVGTVVISGDGAGDQAGESPEVNVLDGWTPEEITADIFDCGRVGGHDVGGMA